ncbi:hypothetical protein F383_27071 [Gossypium arboreum]|uniref:Uncharacterized protein n=1 Tax=Gossypium arboreum TaxID=29729 RepID=A0A0B0P3A8_GOSAR|nr:hypothetical protein F383_27071 [Gossypium arboreum]
MDLARMGNSIRV